MKILKKTILSAVALFVAVSLAELMFLLPGVKLPASQPIKYCSLAEGSVTGWPFKAFVPGCGSSGSNGGAFAIDIVIDLILGVLIVLLVSRLIKKRFGREQ